MYSQQMFNEYDQSTSTCGPKTGCSALCRSWGFVAYLPAANAEQEAHDIALLLLLKLLEVLVGTHLRRECMSATAVWCLGMESQNIGRKAVSHHSILPCSQCLLLDFSMQCFVPCRCWRGAVGGVRRCRRGLQSPKALELDFTKFVCGSWHALTA